MVKLKNYLRMCRKRIGLSQEEVAYLLGSDNSATQVLNYEKSQHLPCLKTLLAFEAIFGVPANELFAGVLQQVEKEIKPRVQLLVQKLEKEEQDRKTKYKLAMLKELACESGAEPGRDR